ncbi:MAG: acylphosphatase [Promethearchaeota archaeon]
MTHEQTNLQLHAFVSGRVQGVFFRVTTKQIAQRLHLVGWVRNCRDGRVEVIAEGSKDKLQELLEWLNQGPRYGHVSQVDHQFLKETHGYRDFQITYH